MKSVPSLFAAMAFAALAGAATPTAAAPACPGVLRIVGAPEAAIKRGAKPMDLELGDCDIRARLRPVIGKPRPTLELAVIGPHASALREGFEAGTPDGAALGNAELRIESIAGDRGVSAIPKGPLLESISARRIAEGHWRWHARSATLRWEGPDAPVLLSTPPGACKGVAEQKLFLWTGTLDVKPGNLIARRPLIARGGPGAFDPLPPACAVRWSLSPGAPASLHAATGVVIVGEADGSSASPAHFSVFAQVGPRVVEGKVAVFQPTRQPLVGTWRQVSERLCGAETERSPARAIQELVFTADGSFRLTWQPFEARYDFWGTYRHDRDSGAIEFRVDGGNAGGRFATSVGSVALVSTSELVISGVDPGAMTDPGQALCAMSFARTQ